MPRHLSARLWLAMLVLAAVSACRCGEAPAPPAPAPVAVAETDAGPAVSRGIPAEEPDAGAVAAVEDAGIAEDAGAQVKAEGPMVVPEIHLDAGVPPKVAVQEPEKPPPPKPVEPAPVAAGVDRTNCATCHAALTKDKKIHPVLKSDGCKACHVPNAGAPGKCQSADAQAWKLNADTQVALCQKCHTAQGTSGKLHAPIKSSGCTACHDPHASANPSLMKTWPVQDLCYKCHGRLDEEKSVHTPVKKGACKDCHDPHSSEFAPLLIAEKATLCFECHKADKLKHGKFAHSPFEESKCLSCHEAHNAENAPILKDSGKALCFSCHAPKATAANGVRAAYRIDLSKKKVHKPVQGDGTCQACHSQQHGADNKDLLLTKTTPETCFKCHAKFDDFAYQHGAVKTGKCTTCHDPHSADEDGLLRASRQKKLCFLCHVDDVSKKRVIHKPILEKGCTACHDPHGADYPFDLTDGEGKALCYKCHKPVDKVAKPHAALLRDGCTGCHDPHGTNNAKLLGQPTNALCISCHETQKDGAHVVFAGQVSHKTFGGSDPKHKEKEFSCVSCHDPHGTDNPKLFYFGSTKAGMCVYCHGEKPRQASASKP